MAIWVQSFDSNHLTDFTLVFTLDPDFRTEFFVRVTWNELLWACKESELQTDANKKLLILFVRNWFWTKSIKLSLFATTTRRGLLDSIWLPFWKVNTVYQTLPTKHLLNIHTICLNTVRLKPIQLSHRFDVNQQSSYRGFECSKVAWDSSKVFKAKIQQKTLD